MSNAYKMKLTIRVLSFVIAILATWAVILVIKNKSLDNQIGTLQSKVELLDHKVSGLEEEKNLLTEKFSNLSSAYRLLAKAGMTSHFNTMPGNFPSGRGFATVIYKSPSCDYFILENQSGYIVAEWMSGNDPNVGDKVTGDFNSFGLRDFYNQTMDSDCSLWIDDYMLDKDDAMDNLKDNCQ